MRKISKHKKTRILRSLFQGDSYGAVAEKEDTSKSTVKMVFDEFVDRASDVSIEEAAVEYNVEDEIEVLRELAVEARKGDFSTGALLAGARILLWMSKLKMDPVEFENYLNMYEGHKKEFGNFLDTATKMSSLEKESGKDCKEIIADFKETKLQLQNLREKLKETQESLTQKKKKLERDIQDLRNTYDSEVANLQDLRNEAAKAQKKIDTLDRRLQILARYNLEIGDFETARAFLDEIQRLGGDAKKAVRILKETRSLEDKLEDIKHELSLQTEIHKERKGKFEQQIEQLKLTINVLEKKVDDESEELRIKKDEKVKIEIRIQELKGKMQALEQQVDGLLEKQAEKLQVLPDIDEISEGMIKGREEIKRLNKIAEERKNQIAVAEAIQNLFAKKPSERKTIIQYLQSAQFSKTHGYFDEKAKKAMIQVMAEQGFIRKEEHEKAMKEAEEKIRDAQQKAKQWHGVAEKRLDDLEKCNDKLKEKIKAEEERLDKQIDQKAANIVAELIKRV